jgi:hypothetical protein
VRVFTKRSLIIFAVTLAAIVFFASLGPPERTLGNRVRFVYLHGAWVWSALAAFLLAALSGIAGLAARRREFQRWSLALGRTGLFFWITYLPISAIAAQTNWNGLFLAEPRWRLAMIFSIGGLVIQLGVSLLDDLQWAALANILYFAALVYALANTPNVMHPPAPIVNSDALRIQIFFAWLLLLTLLAGWQIARWLYRWHVASAEVHQN